MLGDRERWNEKWRERAGELEAPRTFLVEHVAELPRRGRALDVAGGAGRHALWLAKRGLDVTMLEVSDVGIARCERRAEELGLAKHIKFRRLDIDEDDLDLAPTFDVVLMVHYLTRDKRGPLAELVVPGGLVIAAQQTVTNLERHAHPSKPYLVERGELETWARSIGFEIVASREDWNDDGRHEAAVIARRPIAVERDEPEPELVAARGSVPLTGLAGPKPHAKPAKVSGHGHCSRWRSTKGCPP